MICVDFVRVVKIYRIMRCLPAMEFLSCFSASTGLSVHLNFQSKKKRFIVKRLITLYGVRIPEFIFFHFACIVLQELIAETPLTSSATENIVAGAIKMYQPFFFKKTWSSFTTSLNEWVNVPRETLRNGGETEVVLQSGHFSISCIKFYLLQRDTEVIIQSGHFLLIYIKYYL